MKNLAKALVLGTVVMSATISEGQAWSFSGLVSSAKSAASSAIQKTVSATSFVTQKVIETTQNVNPYSLSNQIVAITGSVINNTKSILNSTAYGLVRAGKIAVNASILLPILAAMKAGMVSEQQFFEICQYKADAIKNKKNRVLYLKELGLELDATPEQISKAYRRMAAMLHPDKNGNVASETLNRLSEMYSHLKNDDLNTGVLHAVISVMNQYRN